MKTTRHHYVRNALGVCGLLFAARIGKAQTNTRDLAAYNALIVAPVGALPALALDDGHARPDREALAVSYGQWRFDIDDAIHHNVGLTLSHRLGSSNTSISATGAYLSLSCGDCSGWTSGGVSLRSILWSSAAADRVGRLPASVHFAVDGWASGARYLGLGHADGYSLAGDVDVGGSVPIGSSRIAIAVVPGIGWGRFNSGDLSGDGFRPMYGVALSWKLKRGVSIDFGARRIVLKDGPTELGAGVSWRKL